MGCLQSLEVQQDAQLDNALDSLRQNDKFTRKLLLLGTGNSGKSTIFKQLKQIHGEKFQKKDRIDGLSTIYDSVLGQIKAILHKRGQFAEKSDDYSLSEEVKASADFIQGLPRESEIDEEIARHIDILWKSPAIQLTFENRDSLSIVDSCPYFFDDIERIGDIDYLPSDKDLLMVRSPTTGVTTARFEIQNNVFEIYDVGGQRNERKKWIHCFDTVTAVLFVTSLTCYDQALFEDETVNAMADSLSLFQEIVNSRWFRRTSIILFLNKVDLFEVKVEQVPLSVCWPDYKYDPGDDKLNKMEHGARFIRDRFHERCSDTRHSRIYNVTCGIDPENITRVFHAVQQIVVNDSLAKGGLL